MLVGVRKADSTSTQVDIFEEQTSQGTRNVLRTGSEWSLLCIEGPSPHEHRIPYWRGVNRGATTAISGSRGQPRDFLKHFEQFAFRLMPARPKFIGAPQQNVHLIARV